MPPLTAEFGGRWHIAVVTDLEIIQCAYAARPDSARLPSRGDRRRGEPPGASTFCLADHPAWANQEATDGADSWLAFAVILPDGDERLLVRRER